MQSRPRPEPDRERETTLAERLHALYPDASRRSLKAWLAAGRVRVNGLVTRRGDVAVRRDDRLELGAPPPAPFPPLLRLVHEDDDLLVIDKPAGLLTIATERQRERTAYRLLRDWMETRNGRVFVVHRLDRETSGLLVFAKSFTAKRRLQAQFESRAPERVYVAVVEGLVRQDEGTLSGRLGEDRSLRVRPVPEGRPREGRTGEGRRGKEAITRFRVLGRTRDTTLLELSLVTGRRGQIRVQLAALGHPIIGDHEYGSRRDPFRRLALHATRLAFVHPGRWPGGRRVAFDSPMPAGWRRA
jgi:23S rRNA pseudouridine1911/1915/1917 synthase